MSKFSSYIKPKYGGDPPSNIYTGLSDADVAQIEKVKQRYTEYYYSEDFKRRILNNLPKNIAQNPEKAEKAYNEAVKSAIQTLLNTPVTKTKLEQAGEITNQGISIADDLPGYEGLIYGHEASHAVDFNSPTDYTKTIYDNTITHKDIDKNNPYLGGLSKSHYNQVNLQEPTALKNDIRMAADHYGILPFGKDFNEDAYKKTKESITNDPENRFYNSSLKYYESLLKPDKEGNKDKSAINILNILAQQGNKSVVPIAQSGLKTTQSVEQDTTNIPKIPKRIGSRENTDGSFSTHLMATETLDGKNWVSFPTLFQNQDGTWIDMSDKPWEDAYGEALRRGEVIEFGTDKDSAIKFGEGSWKQKMQNNEQSKETINNHLKKSQILPQPYQSGSFSWNSDIKGKQIEPVSASVYRTTNGLSDQRDIEAIKKDRISKQAFINANAKEILSVKKPGEFTDEDIFILSQTDKIDGIDLILGDDRIAKANDAQKKDNSWTPEGFANSTQAVGDKLSLRRLPVIGRSIPEFLDVTKGIGDMAAGLGRIPLDMKEGNYGSAAFNVGLPLATGAIAGLGIKPNAQFMKGNGQFINELINPIAGVTDLLSSTVKRPKVNRIKPDSPHPLAHNYQERINLADKVGDFIKTAGKDDYDLLSSTEGRKRLGNQFREHNSEFSDKDINDLVENRLESVLEAIEDNPGSIAMNDVQVHDMFPDLLTDDHIERFIPHNNAYFSNQPVYNNKDILPTYKDFFKGREKNLFSDEAKKFSDGFIKRSFSSPVIIPGHISTGEKYLNDIVALKHEIGHALQNSGQMPLDKELRGLIKTDNSVKGRLDNLYRKLNYKKYREYDYDSEPEEFNQQLNYFLRGSRGMEPVPFARELRENMLQNGIIKDQYEKITSSKLLKAKKELGVFDVGNRLIHFIPPWDYGKLSKLMNKLPAVVPGMAATGAVLKSQTNSNSNNNNPKVSHQWGGK